MMNEPTPAKFENLLPATHDPLGLALQHYQSGQRGLQLRVSCDRTADDVLPVDYLFRTFRQMPHLERAALRACRGRVADVGAGAGAHALWLQRQGLAVTALDHSAAAVAVMRARGVTDARATALHHFNDEKFDTVLLLMNGAGLAGTLAQLPALLAHLANWLLPGGQMLLDSSEVLYLYEDENGGYRLNLNDRYHGELVYQMHYAGRSSFPFPWLFVGFDLLADAAHAVGLRAERLFAGPHHHYLARIGRP